MNWPIVWSNSYLPVLPVKDSPTPSTACNTAHDWGSSSLAIAGCCRAKVRQIGLRASLLDFNAFGVLKSLVPPAVTPIWKAASSSLRPSAMGLIRCYVEPWSLHVDALGGVLLMIPGAVQGQSHRPNLVQVRSRFGSSGAVLRRRSTTCMQADASVFGRVRRTVPRLGVLHVWRTNTLRCRGLGADGSR